MHSTPPHASSTFRFPARAALRRQRGVTLAVSLILLLLITIVSVMTINTGVLRDNAGGNLRNQDLALQAAESALREGESALVARTAGGDRPVADDSPGIGIWLPESAIPFDQDWWNANSVEYGGHGRQISGTAADPRYIVEEHMFVADSAGVPTGYGSASGIQYYRITARAVGATSGSQAGLESTYRIRFK